MGVLLLFFDGVGIGADDSGINPFAATRARSLSVVAGQPVEPEASFAGLDATLGVAGLPQSATGQTTLLTGVNAARLAGRHMFGLPGPTLRPLLEDESLFLKLVRAGKSPTFANAYTAEHLEARRPRWSASTRAVQASGIPFRMLDPDVESGGALFHDYTGERIRERGLPCRTHDATSAARVLASLTDDHDFVLYEYFLTDLAGHRGTWEDKLEQARRVEALVEAACTCLDLSRHLLLVVSDHGNLEDASSKTHTLNPVPLLAWGKDRERFTRRVNSMADLTPAIVESLSGT